MINDVTLDVEERFVYLGEQVNKNFSKLFSLQEIIDSSYDYLFGYFEDNLLLGFIHVNCLYENLDIVNLVVDEKERRKGIATKLLDFVISYFPNVDQILLEVNENNKAAISLYLKNSFSVLTKRFNYYGNDAALVMKRDVKNERC